MSTLSLRTDVLSLTPLEQIGPRQWNRPIYPIQMPENYDIEAVSYILREGLKAAKRRVPMFNSEIVPDTQSVQASALKIQPMDLNQVNSLEINDLRDSTSFTMSFAELKAAGFPIAAFPETLCRTPLWSPKGDPWPAVLAQANFINGGILLNLCAHHTICDGFTLNTVTMIWAEECCLAEGFNVTRGETTDEKLLEGRAAVMGTNGTLFGYEGRPEDHPELTIFKDPETGIRGAHTIEGQTGQVFRFNADDLSRLKQEVSHFIPATGSPGYISTNDIVTALIWKTVMLARFAQTTVTDVDKSILNVCVGGRTRLKPAVHSATLGCFLTFCQIELPLRQLISSDGLAQTALAIRSAIHQIDRKFHGGFANDVMEYVKRQSDLRQIAASCFSDLAGFNMLLTKWPDFDWYDLEWGSLGKIAAIRTPRTGLIPNMQIILPKLANGGIEIMICAQEEVLGRIRTSPLLSKYASM